MSEEPRLICPAGSVHLLSSVRTISGAHPASCSLVTGVKAAGYNAYNFVSRLGKSGALLPRPNTPSWRHDSGIAAGCMAQVRFSVGSCVRIGSGTDADCVPWDVRGPSEGVNLPECEADSECRPLFDIMVKDTPIAYNHVAG